MYLILASYSVFNDRLQALPAFKLDFHRAFKMLKRLLKYLERPLNFQVVGSSGLEPPTSRLSGARSNQLSYEPIVSGTYGGDDGIRTHDPLLAGQVLSQLSYTPI